jgi:hypothetical protein
VGDDEAGEHEEQVDAQRPGGDQRPQHADRLGDPAQRREVEGNTTTQAAATIRSPVSARISPEGSA